MSAIEFCGWIDARLTDQATTANLEAMARKLPGDATTYARPGFGLARLCADMDWYSEGAMCAVIIGRPQWKSSALSEIADRQGHAKALAEAYRTHGEKLFPLLHGSFSFAVYDENERFGLLAIDRMGIGALSYVAAPGGQVVFGTRADAVAQHPAAGDELSLQSVYHYLFFHVIPAPDTIFQTQKKLLPGHFLRVRGDNTAVVPYWSPDFTQARDHSLSRLSAELREKLKTAVARCAPDNHTGAFLSGGLDSSTVAGYLAESSDSDAKTYSIGFDVEGYDETEYARITARHFGTQQHEYYVTPQDVVDSVPLIARAYDEPFGNSSAVPVYHCARFAKEDGIRRMLAGDGGDELFAGNARYAKTKIFEYYYKIPSALRSGLIEPLAFHFPGAKHISPLRKAQSYISQAKIPMPDRLESYNLLLRIPPQEMFQSEFLASVDPQGPFDLLHGAYHHDDADLLDRMLLLDWRITLADNDLRKVNRMCATAGVDVLFPMLDDDLVEFSTRIPSDLKLPGTKLRYFYKKALDGFLPQEVITKPKHGFGLPFGLWMKSYAPLKELAYDSLSSLAKRHYLRREYLNQLIELHQTDHAAFYGEFIWVLMMLELWLQDFERARQR